MNNSYFEAGRDILKRLNDKGFESYFVGGVVRDKILNLEFDDIDICTSAAPDEIKSIFTNHKETGIDFGTVTVFSNEFHFDVTTFRVEEEYKNNRKPKKVHYSKNLSDDLVRRDFTINALAMTYGQKIVDLNNGLKDIEKGVIRTIGNPKKRFTEDALRILRAFRFVSKLNFKIDPKTMSAMKSTRKLLKNLSHDRILSELTKVFEGKHNKKAIALMVSLGIHKQLDQYSEGLRVLSSKVGDLNVEECFALCFKLNDASITEVNLSSNTKNRLKQIIDLSSVTVKDPYDEILVFTYGKDVCVSANKINVALKKSRPRIKQIEKIDHALPIRDICDLKFKGEDILQLTGGKSGPFVGSLIDDIKMKVLKKELANDYTTLRNYAVEQLETTTPSPPLQRKSETEPKIPFREQTQKPERREDRPSADRPFFSRKPDKEPSYEKPFPTKGPSNYDQYTPEPVYPQKMQQESSRRFDSDQNSSYEDRLKQLENRIIAQERELRNKDQEYDELQKQILRQKYDYERERLISANIEALERMDYVKDGYQKAAVAREMEKVVKRVLEDINQDYRKLEDKDHYE